MKKKIITVLIAIITVIPLVLVVPKADTVSSTVTSYGSYTVTYEDNQTSGFSIGLGNLGFEIPISGGSTITFRYDFNSAKTGSFQINVTTYGNYKLGDCYFSLDGGTFTTVPSLSVSSKNKAFKVTFTNTKYVYFTLYIPYPTQFANITTPISLTSVNIQDGVDLQDIDTALDFYLPGMSSSLTNIASNTSTMASDIAIIKGYLDGVEGYVDNIEPYLNDLININKIQSRPLYQQSVLLWALSYSELNYDNLFPSFDYSTSNNNSAYTAINRLCLSPNSTYSLYIYTINQLGANSWNIYMRGNDTPITSTRTYAFTPPSTSYFLYRFDFTNNSSSHVYFEIEFLNDVTIMPLFYGNKNNVPDDIHYLFGDELNNTYTRLLQSINNGISTLNSDYDTSQYEQYEQTIDGLNDNMRDNFNNSETSFQNNLNNILTPDQISGGSNTIFEQFHFNAINGVFTGFLGQLFNAAPVLQYLLLFGLLLLVLGVFI